MRRSRSNADVVCPGVLRVFYLFQQLAQCAPDVFVLFLDGYLEIRVELPGVKLEDVYVTLQNVVFTIPGEHSSSTRAKWLLHAWQRRYGSFRRSMDTARGTDESNIHARFEDFVLFFFFY